MNRSADPSPGHGGAPRAGVSVGGALLEADRRVSVTDTNLVRFRAAVAGALAHLESRREEVNLLNVFSVADGDTGDKMALTCVPCWPSSTGCREATSSARSMRSARGDRALRRPSRPARARGNSGVILSQLIRGAAEELVAGPGS